MAFFQIAGLTVQMDPKESTLSQNSLAYRLNTDCPPHIDMEITLSPEKIAELQALEPNMRVSSIEYMYTGAIFYNKLLTFQGFMLHSSAIVYQGQAYLFSAPSGTGKSTHTQLWRTCFGEENTYILNDDKPALRLTPDGWMAYGTPFSGKYDISRNTGVPIKAICFIERSETNHIELMSEKEAIQNLMFQTQRPRKIENMNLLLQLLDKLVGHVPVFKLRCNMDPEAAYLAYETMSKA